MRDPYDILGVKRTATHDEIKKAYRKLAKELHPDRNQGDAKIAERFKEVSAAYGIVGDEKQRARFDRGEIDAQGNERAPFGFGAGGPRSRPGAGAGGGGGRRFHFEDQEGFDDDIFADFFRANRGGGPRSGGRGNDRKYNLAVAFLDAARGAKRRVTLGDGRTLDISIPAGIVEGQSIRLKNQGDPGVGGGQRGDALIEISIEPHAFFTRKGDDIHVEVPVNLREAVLGGKITVPTIDGPVALTVPRRANSGTTLRLKGRGVTKRGEAAERGDQYVKLKVVLPAQPDAALEKFVEGWSGGDEDPRAGMEIE